MSSSVTCILLAVEVAALLSQSLCVCYSFSLSWSDGFFLCFYFCNGSQTEPNHEVINISALCGISLLTDECCFCASGLCSLRCDCSDFVEGFLSYHDLCLIPIHECYDSCMIKTMPMLRKDWVRYLSICCQKAAFYTESPTQQTTPSRHKLLDHHPDNVPKSLHLDRYSVLQRGTSSCLPGSVNCHHAQPRLKTQGLGPGAKHTKMPWFQDEYTK